MTLFEVHFCLNAINSLNSHFRQNANHFRNARQIAQRIALFKVHFSFIAFKLETGKILSTKEFNYKL